MEISFPIQMKTFEEILYFCNEFTFYDLYNIERVIELNDVSDCKINVLYEYEFMIADMRILVIDVIDDKSLMIMDKDVENTGRDRNNHRVGISQLLCLEKLCEEEADNKNMEVITANGKEIIRCDKSEHFQIKKGAQLNYVGA